jgi:hypothetical protein
VQHGARDSAAVLTATVPTVQQSVSGFNAPPTVLASNAHRCARVQSAQLIAKRLDVRSGASAIFVTVLGPRAHRQSQAQLRPRLLLPEHRQIHPRWLPVGLGQRYLSALCAVSI